MKHYDDFFYTLEDLYLSSYRLVYSFIHDYTKDKHMVDEISSVVWLKITREPKKYLKMDKQKLFNYLKLMVKTAYIDCYNRNKKETEKLRDFYEFEYKEIIFANNDEKLLEEDYTFLEAALGILTDDEKRLIKLKYNQGLTYKELSPILNASEGSLRTKQSRIYEKLKAEIIRLKKESEC